MFDTSLRRHIDPILNRIGKGLASLGITANAVTFAGFGIGVAAAGAIVYGHMIWGLALILLSRLCDGLDGAVARATQKSDLGGFYDIVLDFAFYGMIPAAFVLHDPAANGWAGAILLLTFYVNGASFLAYAWLAEKAGVSEAERGSKSLLYTTGLAEASETLFVFVLFCLLPGWFSVTALVFSAIVIATTIARFGLARQNFS